MNEGIDGHRDFVHSNGLSRALKEQTLDWPQTDFRGGLVVLEGKQRRKAIVTSWRVTV